MDGGQLPRLCSISGKQYEGRKTKECDAPLSRYKFMFEQHFLSFCEGKEALKMKEEEEKKSCKRKQLLLLLLLLPFLPLLVLQLKAVQPSCVDGAFLQQC